jgi:hypothetical protein
MSDQLARRVAVARAIDSQITAAEADASQTADIPDTFARRHAVIGQRFGTLSAALALGDDQLLQSALLGIGAAASEWLGAIEEDNAR